MLPPELQEVEANRTPVIFFRKIACLYLFSMAGYIFITLKYFNIELSFISKNSVFYMMITGWSIISPIILLVISIIFWLKSEEMPGILRLMLEGNKPSDSDVYEMRNDQQGTKYNFDGSEARKLACWNFLLSLIGLAFTYKIHSDFF